MYYSLDTIRSRATAPDENGWQLASVTLAKGDTTWNPGSSKYHLTGAGDYTYELHPSGINVHVPESSSRVLV